MKTNLRPIDGNLSLTGRVEQMQDDFVFELKGVLDEEHSFALQMNLTTFLAFSTVVKIVRQQLEEGTGELCASTCLAVSHVRKKLCEAYIERHEDGKAWQEVVEQLDRVAPSYSRLKNFLMSARNRDTERFRAAAASEEGTLETRIENGPYDS